MQYEVYKVKPETYEREFLIEDITGLEWADDLDNIFINFNFTAKNKNTGFDKLFSDTSNIDINDWIELYCPFDKKTVFLGKITKTEIENINFIKYSGYDYGLLCDKSKIILDCKTDTVSQAIKKACDKANIKTGYIETIDKPVKKIFKNMTVSEVINSIYEIGIKGGEKDEYFFDCKNGKVNLYKYKENNDLKGYIANIYSINSFEYASSFSLKKEENKENEGSFTVLGDYNTQKGVITKIVRDDIGIKGSYLINYSKHNIIGSKELIETKLKNVENL